MEDMKRLKTLVELGQSKGRREFLVRFNILKGLFSGYQDHIPEITDDIPDDRLESLYLETVTAIQIKCDERNTKKEEMLKSLIDVDKSSEIYRNSIRGLIKELIQEDVDDDKLSEIIEVYNKNRKLTKEEIDVINKHNIDEDVKHGSGCCHNASDFF